MTLLEKYLFCLINVKESRRSGQDRPPSDYGEILTEMWMFCSCGVRTGEEGRRGGGGPGAPGEKCWAASLIPVLRRVAV